MHEPDPDRTARADAALSAALRAVADADAGPGASPAVEARLKAELRTLVFARRRRARRVVAAFAAAAVVVAAVALFKSEVGSLKSDQNSDFRLQTSTGTQRSEVTTAFMPLAYSGVPIADGHVVRMEVPRAALVSFGLVPLDAVDNAAGGTVLADVIVGDDGLARAVRFVRKTARKEQQP